MTTSGNCSKTFAGELEKCIDPQKPLVFQCRSCNIVLGDSSSWVCANSDLRTFTLRDVSENLTSGNTLLTSQTGPDLGSTYYMLNCSSCNGPVGRIYKTTSKNLDEMRDMFTLEFDFIVIYQVAGKPADPIISDDLLNFPTLASLDEQLKKVKRLMVVLNNRIVTVEQSLQIDNQTTQFLPSNNTTIEANECYAANSIEDDKRHQHEIPRQNVSEPTGVLSDQSVNYKRAISDAHHTQSHSKRKVSEHDVLYRINLKKRK